MALFTRTLPVPASPPVPAPETWAPEGTLVSQRYQALERATVLVYTADADRGTACYAAACLGCTYRVSETTADSPMSEAEAAEAANMHASACRAMPRGVPARPEDPEAVGLVRSRLSRHRYGTSPRRVHIADFNALRVDLQRSTAWIKALLESLAQSEPGFLTSAPTSDGQGTRFTVQPLRPALTVRARTALLAAAAVPVTLAAAAAILKAGHWRLYADRHRIHLTPVARRSCTDCRGEVGWWAGGPNPEMEACGCWSERRELRIRLLPVPAGTDEPPTFAPAAQAGAEARGRPGHRQRGWLPLRSLHPHIRDQENSGVSRLPVTNERLAFFGTSW
ncbi:hypothetical protein [Streptomyces anulatus]|uniref:hypothetical protein n=1 Tax=Streptomyces anulatus TaxID=1892 RepID=UPI002F916085